MNLIHVEADAVETLRRRGLERQLIAELNGMGNQLMVISGWGDRRLSRDERSSALHFLARIRPPVLLTPGLYDLRMGGTWIGYLAARLRRRPEPTLPEALPTFECESLAVMGVGSLRSISAVLDHSARIRTFYLEQASNVFKVLVLPERFLPADLLYGQECTPMADDLLALVTSCGVELVLAYGAEQPVAMQVQRGNRHTFFILAAMGPCDRSERTIGLLSVGVGAGEVSLTRTTWASEAGRFVTDPFEVFPRVRCETTGR